MWIHGPFCDSREGAGYCQGAGERIHSCGEIRLVFSAHYAVNDLVECGFEGRVTHVPGESITGAVAEKKVRTPISRVRCEKWAAVQLAANSGRYIRGELATPVIAEGSRLWALGLRDCILQLFPR